ncbi:MAG: DUF5615 family PIN-like protein [Deltaproteobacteria bacterium]|nr:DUF5615 family PIN-like protein [Deltaproteobacteria bacterium]
MRFWLDAHLSPALARWLCTEHGVEAMPLRDLGLDEVEDEQIFEAARQASVCVMTKDRDFVEMVHRLGTPPQILWVTCGNTSTRALTEILTASFPAARQLLEQGEALVEITDSRNSEP